jgi:hypothetical protein
VTFLTVFNLNYLILAIPQIDSLNIIRGKNKNEEDDSQKDTSKKVQASFNCEKQVLELSEPDQLTEGNEETSEVQREGSHTPQADNGKSCFQCPNNNHVL